ncbi:glutamine-dependent NAD(+) synthetase, partial [Aureobasidium melanogenum]
MLRLHEPSATPCPVPVLPPSSSRRTQHNGRRDSLLGMVSAGDDDTTANLEFTSAFGAGTLRNNKPRRRQAAGRNKDNGPGFAIHEDANREDGKINMMEKRESALAQPAKRAVRLPGPSPAASQQRSRNHQAPPHPELARRLNKDPRRPTAMAPRPLDTLPEDSRLTLNSTTVLKPARRGTIFIPNDDTTMPSMYMGIFSPIKNLDARLGSDAGEVEITGIAAQMAQKRSFRRSMITTSPKRAPLHVLGKDSACSNVVAEDRIGQGSGKENVPPGHNAIGDEKAARKASLSGRQSIQRPPICEMKPVETDVILGTRPATSNRKDHPVQRQPSKAPSKTTRLYEPTAGSSERNKERKPARRPNAKPVWNSGSRLKQFHVPPTMVEPSRSNTIQQPPDQTVSRKPAVPTRFIVPNVKVEALPDAYPLLTEDIAIPSMYEENWLSHQEISITQLVNNFFEAASPKQSSTEAGMLRIRLLEKYGNADSAMLYKRLQAALLFGALSIPSEVLRSAGRLNNDLGRRRAFTDLWLETYSLSCLQPALEVVVGRQCGIPSPGRRSSGNSTAPREALQRFIETFLVRNEDGSHSEQPGTDHGAWSYQRTLLRSLMLIKVLDMAKEPSTPLASGCLFQASSTHKTSVDVAKALFQLLNPSAGDPIRALSHVGYVVTHSQYPLEEYTYKIDNLAVDLRDGVRLTRLVELLLYPSATRSLEQLRDHESTSTTTVLLPTGELLSLEEGQPDWPLSQHLKFPCLGRATKLYNVQIALSAIQGVKGMTAVVQDICPEDIVDGYREKTVRLLWGLTSKWGLGGLVEWPDVVREIKRLRRTIDNNRQHHSPIDYFDIMHDDEFGDDYASGPARYQMLLKSWAQAIAAKNGLAVTNLTSSFADTRVFEAIVDEYEAYISTDGTSGSRSVRVEGDTFLHSWEVLAEIISDPVCKDMLVDLGMGVRHRNVRYNCRVLCTYKRVLFIRPKMALANDGLYREARHFTAWPKKMQVETYYLEAIIEKVTGQHTVPIGDAILSTLDTAVGCETCEELFTPSNPSTYMGLNINGKVLEQGSQFSLAPVEVIVATIDIEEVRSFRCSISRNVQGAAQPEYPRVEFDFRLCRPVDEVILSDTLKISREKELRILDPMSEIWMSTSVYLWQYLTRTNSAGFFLSLSGGLDSSTVALFVHGMARLVLRSIELGEENTLADLRRVTGLPDLLPKSPEEIVNLLLTTCYQGTVNSSDETRSRAKRLAERLGAYHLDISIDEAVEAHQSIIRNALQFTPKYSVEGGTPAENLALQNVQARNRMVVQYSLAQLATTARKLPRAGSALLVLTSGNVDENLRGYYTKYDASSGDLAPLGSISKNDAKRFQRWARETWDLPIMTEFIEATPTAELLPLSAGVQDDESPTEMGMSYEELSVFGILRRVEKLGPWSSYVRLLYQWQDRPGMTPRKIAEKVMHFFRFYSINRHKATIITPSIHLSAYNPDDNRHDLRPFLYVVNWPYQFDKIMKHVDFLEAKQQQLEEKK